MRIAATTLLSIEKRETFFEVFSEYTTAVLGDARLFPKLSMIRVMEAHGAWMNDLKRVGDNEPHLEDGLDHFKRCGHLAFWIRRMAPVVEAVDLINHLGDAEGYPITQDEQAFRDLFFGYCNEYLAFDFGYQICKYHEISKAESSQRASNLVPSEEYYRTMCHFLKYKTVSPHAMFLIYKSLFLT